MSKITTLRHNDQATEGTIEVTSACILGLEIYTNGPQGGDSGHGCRTELTFKNLAGVDMEVTKDGDAIILSFGGDCELECLAEVLRFAADALNHYRCRS